MKPIHWLLAAILLWPAAFAHAVITNVDEASDICIPSADPCIIDQEVQIKPGAVIDFGARDVQLIARGLLNSGNGSVVFRCGDFTANVGGANTAIEARNAAGGGGNFTLEARRTCSGSATDFCFSDTDCSFGSCSAQLFCSGDQERTCESDADCDAGTCSVGTGSVSIDGRILANGSANGPPGTVSITAADDIETQGVIKLAADTRDDDGGFLDLVSSLGSVTVGGNVEGTAGRDSTGGDVSIDSGADVVINGVIDVNGGDFDGGNVDVIAGRDISINADILARSVAGEGFGGSLSFAAGRDLTIGGSVRIDTGGHQSSEGFCGDAGIQTFDALGDMTMAAEAKLESNGAEPDCGGDIISINIGGDLTIAGRIESKSTGLDGAGGTIDVLVGGNSTFTPSSSIDVGGGSLGGGTIDIAAGTDLVFDGIADGRAVNRGRAREIKLAAVGEAVIGGSVMLDGTGLVGGVGGILRLDACRVRVGSGAVIFNGGINGQNRFTGRETIVTVAGSQITAEAVTGLNRFEYRDATSPPVLGGTITPSPQTILNTLLPSCSVCGDGRVDLDEACDDGDSTWETGQFCSESCSMLSCGDPDNSGNVRATDALIVLTTAVGITTCDACVCNVDASTGNVPVTATDALGTLSTAVGLGNELICPPCM